jgi:hypothetical protein
MDACRTRAWLLAEFVFFFYVRLIKHPKHSLNKVVCRLRTFRFVSVFVDSSSDTDRMYGISKDSEAFFWLLALTSIVKFSEMIKDLHCGH